MSRADSLPLAGAYYSTGDRVALKRYPHIPCIVLKHMLSPARADSVYSVRFEDKPEDTRGFLAWEEDIKPWDEILRHEVQS